MVWAGTQSSPYLFQNVFPKFVHYGTIGYISPSWAYMSNIVKGEYRIYELNTNTTSAVINNISINGSHTKGEVRNIVITNMPDKTTYTAGETFDSTGLVLTAQNLINAHYDLENHAVVEELDEEYTLTTYSLDKTTLSAGDTSVNAYVVNPVNNIKVEIPITVSE
jgi:hypothetical protein